MGKIANLAPSACCRGPVLASRGSKLVVTSSRILLDYGSGAAAGFASIVRTLDERARQKGYAVARAAARSDPPRAILVEYADVERRGAGRGIKLHGRSYFDAGGEPDVQPVPRAEWERLWWEWTESGARTYSGPAGSQPEGRSTLLRQVFRRFEETSTGAALRALGQVRGGTKHWFVGVPDASEVAEYLEGSRQALVFYNDWRPGEIARACQRAVNAAPPPMVIFLQNAPMAQEEFGALVATCDRLAEGSLANALRKDSDVPLSSWHPAVVVFGRHQPRVGDLDAATWSCVLPNNGAGTANVLVPHSRHRLITECLGQLTKHVSVSSVESLRRALAHYVVDPAGQARGLSGIDRAGELLLAHFSPQMLRAYAAAGYCPALYVLTVEHGALGETSLGAAAFTGTRAVLPENIGASVGANIHIGNAVVVSERLPGGPLLIDSEDREVIEGVIRRARDQGVLGNHAEAEPFKHSGTPGGIHPARALETWLGGRPYKSPVMTQLPDGTLQASTGALLQDIPVVVFLDLHLPGHADEYITLKWIQDGHDVIRISAPDLSRGYVPPPIEDRPLGPITCFEATESHASWAPFLARVAPLLSARGGQEAGPATRWLAAQAAAPPTTAPPAAAPAGSSAGCRWVIYARTAGPIGLSGFARAAAVHEELRRQRNACVAHALRHNLEPHGDQNCFEDECPAAVPPWERPGFQKLVASGAGGVICCTPDRVLYGHEHELISRLQSYGLTWAFADQ